MTQPTTLAQSLIGKELEVVGSTNKTLVGLVGTVIDETQYTFVVDTLNGHKTVLKSSVTFTVGDDATQIKGASIQKRAEARIKQ